MLQAIKNYFSNSGTLMLAASTMVGGAAAAGAAAIDWGNLVDTAFASGFNWKVVMAAGVTAFVQGAVTYVTRTRGTVVVDVAGKPVLAPAVPTAAVPTSEEGKAVVVKKTKK